MKKLVFNSQSVSHDPTARGHLPNANKINSIKMQQETHFVEPAGFLLTGFMDIFDIKSLILSRLFSATALSISLSFLPHFEA